MKLTWTLAAVAVAVVYAAPPAIAACKPFTAFSTAEGREVGYNDLDNNGKVSIGDKRFGYNDLTDANGKVIGTRYFVATVNAVDQAGKAASHAIDIIIALSDGTIFTTFSNQKPPTGVFSDTGKTISTPGPNTFVILGGTEAYSGATGTMEFIRKPEATEFEFRFDISCP